MMVLLHFDFIGGHERRLKMKRKEKKPKPKRNERNKKDEVSQGLI